MLTPSDNPAENFAGGDAGPLSNTDGPIYHILPIFDDEVEGVHGKLVIPDDESATVGGVTYKREKNTT